MFEEESEPAVDGEDGEEVVIECEEGDDECTEEAVVECQCEEGDEDC